MDQTLRVMVEMGREAKLILDGTRVSSMIAQAYGDRRGSIDDAHCAGRKLAESWRAEACSKLDTLSMLSVRLGLCAHQQAFLDLL